VEQDHTKHNPVMTRDVSDFVKTQLTVEALSCYWLKALVVYCKVYFSQKASDYPFNISSACSYQQ
jgi:hypothetical protein